MTDRPALTLVYQLFWRIQRFFNIPSALKNGCFSSKTNQSIGWEWQRRATTEQDLKKYHEELKMARILKEKVQTRRLRCRLQVGRQKGMLFALLDKVTLHCSTLSDSVPKTKEVIIAFHGIWGWSHTMNNSRWEENIILPQGDRTAKKRLCLHHAPSIRKDDEILVLKMLQHIKDLSFILICRLHDSTIGGPVPHLPVGILPQIKVPVHEPETAQSSRKNEKNESVAAGSTRIGTSQIESMANPKLLVHTLFTAKMIPVGKRQRTLELERTSEGQLTPAWESGTNVCIGRPSKKFTYDDWNNFFADETKTSNVKATLKTQGVLLKENVRWSDNETIKVSIMCELFHSTYRNT